MEIGSVVEGKVTGVMKFGAFVALPEGKSGLCHISEISNSYVSDINEHVKLGDIVKVKVIAISTDGKINLSIKKAEPPSEASRTSDGAVQRSRMERRQLPKTAVGSESAPPAQAAGPSDDKDFEQKLKKFMQDSDNRMASDPRYADRPRKNRRR